MDVKQVAALANLTITASETNTLQSEFAQTLKTVEKINELDTSSVITTPQIIGLENVTRLDRIDPSRVLSQTSAISQAQQTHNGYIVVSSVFDAQ